MDSAPPATGGGDATNRCMRISYLKPLQEALGKFGPTSVTREDQYSALTHLVRTFRDLAAPNNSFGVVKISHRTDERLQREHGILANLDSPFLVRVFQVDPKQPPRWYIMEEFKRGSSSVIARRPSQSAGERGRPAPATRRPCRREFQGCS